MHTDPSETVSAPAQVWPLVGANIPAATLLQRVQAIRPSLGASGAVIALFAMVAARQPERQVRMFALVEKQNRGSFLARGAFNNTACVFCLRRIVMTPLSRHVRRLPKH